MIEREKEGSFVAGIWRLGDMWIVVVQKNVEVRNGRRKRGG